MRKVLNIITGPPGSGKTTLAEKMSRESEIQNGFLIPIYDRDLGNLTEWESDRSPEITVTVTAPKVMQKQGWIERATAAGRLPRLYTLIPNRMVSHTRAEQRDVRNGTHTLEWIKYWYENYRRHHLETHPES